MLEFPKPQYTRPRLRQGEKPDVRDDIFALGTTLYEISTGQKPYQEKSDNEIAALFRSRIYPDLQELSPPGLGDIIRSCWSERYVNAEQVVCDLRRIMLVFRRSLLILRRLSSSPGATTLVPLGQVAVNDLFPLNLCALYLSPYPEETLAMLMLRGQGQCRERCILIEVSVSRAIDTEDEDQILRGSRTRRPLFDGRIRQM